MTAAGPLAEFLPAAAPGEAFRPASACCLASAFTSRNPAAQLEFASIGGKIES